MNDEDDLDRAIDRWMRNRPAPQAPGHFRAAVMAQIRQERWKVERYWDLGFNLAVAFGLMLIVAGVLGLAHLSGLSVVGRDAVAIFAEAVTTTAARSVPALPVYMGGFLLTAAALGLWWFVES